MLQKFIAYLRKNWGKIYFTIAIAAIIFTYGYLVGAHHKFPHSVIADAIKTYRLLKTQSKNEFPGLNPARYEGVGVVVHNTDLAYPGVTLIGSPWKDGDDWSHSLRLVGMDGKLLHKWTVEPEDIWPESPHDDLMKGAKATKLGTHIHGTVLFPGGDIVLNMSHYALLRLNACSEIVWTVPYRTHHSVFMDENGNFWAPGDKWHSKPVREFPGFSPPFVEDTIVQVSPDGEIIREISILESIYRSGYEGLVFSSKMEKYGGDITHNNDVEVLSTDLANDFAGLEAGDIMVSLRNISTVLIIDGKTERVKWMLQHPIVRQHDPDFMEGGYISIFDNRADPKGGNAPSFGGSRIIRVKPSTTDTEILYASNEENYFYTRGGGKHQHLKNGNILIGEPYAGRVFEVTKSGEVVWSWLVEHWADGDIRVSEVHDGTRYPLEYGNIPSECS
ncbi:MAG: arylsulfotransferase family protein [Pseudomonadota bacterium]